MKRILAILCAVTMAALLFAGCGGTETPATAPPTTAAENPPTELQLLVPGTLSIGTEIGYPPFEMFATDGKTPIGFDIDLGKAIAEILGLAVEHVDHDFETILPGLNIDKYDIVMSAVTITGERSQIVDFSNSYVKNWQSIVVLAGSDPIASPQDLQGKKVSYQKGTTSTKYLDDLINTTGLTCEVASFAKVLQCFDELRLGRVDAVLCDSVVTADYLYREPGVFEMTWVQSEDADAEPEMFGIAVKKGNETLLAAVNDALAQLEASGRLDEIREDWQLLGSK
ncbi:MAG: transporter substrate-binding domain-containing protein [Oscillospiraceae bacterium]|nr:transporter substrate-binding domain-containing protein [Oscillospiraceae bacterium]